MINKKFFTNESNIWAVDAERLSSTSIADYSSPDPLALKLRLCLGDCLGDLLGDLSTKEIKFERTFKVTIQKEILNLMINIPFQPINFKTESSSMGFMNFMKTKTK